MRWNIFFRALYLLIYRIGLATTYGYFAFSDWTSLTICYQRISIIIFLILLLGFHTCLTPTRLFLKNSQFFDFEFTLIGTLVFISNEIETDSCMDDNEVTYLQFSEYTFYCFLLGNCLSFLLYILWIFIYVLVRVFRYGESFSEQNFLVFHNQDLNANNSEGLTFHELNRLKRCKYEKPNDDVDNSKRNSVRESMTSSAFINPNKLQKDAKDKIPPIKMTKIEEVDNKKEIMRNKVCSICLNDFEAGENLIKLPECDHLFHSECIMDWLKGHIICPYCRCDIRAALEKENPLINRIEINVDQN